MQIFQRYSRRKQIKFQYWWRCRFFIKYIQSFHRTRIYSLQNKFFEDRRWRVINLELYIEATSSFSFYIKKTLFLIMKMQSFALLRLLCRDSIRDTFADWNVVLANSGIYGFSPRAVVRSRISHATRRGPRLDLSSPEKDKREQEGEIVGVNFDRLNTVISKWKRSRLGHTISCCVSRHFYPLPSAPRRVLTSFLSPPVPRLFSVRTGIKFRKFAAPLHHSQRGKARETGLAPPRPRFRACETPV